MPQFTAKSLARVLVQVEREILVEAVELAELESFFLTADLGTIRELQGFFNLISNLQTFGFALLENLLIERKQELGPTTIALGTFIIEQFVKLVDIGDVGTASGEKLDQLVEKGSRIIEILEQEAEEFIPTDREQVAALLLSAADELRFISTLDLQPRVAVNSFVRVRANVEAAFVIVT